MDKLTMDHSKTLCVVVMLVAALSYQVVISADIGDEQEFYGILVDAGSSSSKMKLYKWTPPKTISSMPRIEIINQTKFRTPISDFTDDLEELDAYVDDMLIWGVENIPESKHRSTPILIQATAGMRFLSGKLTYKLLTKVREILSNESMNPFAPTLHNDVSVLSGEEEGVYAWIAANYLLGFFESKKPVNESVGVLEMGGGSTQIAFIPEGPLYDGEFQVSLANRRYSIYVHSYLNFGVSGMQRQVINHIMSGMTTKQEYVSDPCMLKDDFKTISLGQKRSLEIRGDSNATRCGEILHQILKPSDGIACQPKPCVIGQVYQPNIGNSPFYATQAFNYAPKQTLHAVRKDGTLDLEQMLNNAQSFCNLTLEEAEEEHPNRTKAYLSSDCLMGNYVPRLFQNFGFYFTTNQIKVTSKINSQKIDWALGAMLMKLSDRFANQRGHFSVLCPNKGSKNHLDGSSSSMTRMSLEQKATSIVISLFLGFVNIRLGGT